MRSSAKKLRGGPVPAVDQCPHQSGHGRWATPGPADLDQFRAAGIPAHTGGGGRRDLIFAASAGRDYVVHFLDGGAASVDALSTPGRRLEFKPGERLDAAQWFVISDLVETLAGWARDNAPVDVTENWMLPQDDSEFAKALGEVLAERAWSSPSLANPGRQGHQ